MVVSLAHLLAPRTLRVAALLLTPGLCLAQFEAPPHEAFVPAGVSRAVVSDWDGDGVRELYLAHGGGVTEVREPAVHVDIDGNALTSVLFDASHQVWDLAAYTNENTRPGGALVTVGPQGLMRWVPEAGAPVGTLLQPWTSATHVTTLTT